MRHELVERARRGDRAAFEQLAAGEVDRLHAIARLVVRDQDMAEDAVQEALVRCWRYLPKLRDVERFDAWMHRLLMRSVYAETAKRRRFTSTVRVIDFEPSVPDETRAVANREELDRGLQRLSIDHRAVVVLRHFEDLPLSDVAAALGIPLGTAKSRYHYAMSSLRASLEADARSGQRAELPA